MCLISIYDARPMSEGTGYKVFWKDECGEIRTPIYWDWQNKFVLNQWYRDPVEEFLHTYPEPNGVYKTGFHIFKYRKDAESLLDDLAKECSGFAIRDFVLARVRYRRAEVEGRYVIDGFSNRDPRPCIVAREMFIEEVY
jgi:hypothetical protein